MTKTYHDDLRKRTRDSIAQVAATMRGMDASRQVKRFTREQYHRKDTTGWRFEAGWFVRMSGLEWAWFSREIEEEEHRGSE